MHSHLPSQEGQRTFLEGDRASGVKFTQKVYLHIAAWPLRRLRLTSGGEV